MKIRTLFLVISVFLGSIIAISASGQDVTNDSITIKSMDGVPVVDVVIEGNSYTFLVDFSMHPGIIINPELAKKHNLKNKGILSRQADVDGEIFKINLNKLRMSIDGGPEKKRKVIWLDRDYWAPFDGVISGPALKYDRVIFNLSNKTGADAKTYSYDLDSEKRWLIKSTLTEKFNYPIFYNFKFHHKISRANLVLTNLIKHSHLITEPVPTNTFEIEREFGVSSIAKKINLSAQLETPLNETYQIVLQVVPDAPIEANSDEVVVEATQKKKSNLSAVYTLGRDYFSSCSKIEFIKSQKKVNLYCS